MDSWRTLKATTWVSLRSEIYRANHMWSDRSVPLSFRVDRVVKVKSCCMNISRFRHSRALI
jgi:hypothetical protein